MLSELIERMAKAPGKHPEHVKISEVMPDETLTIQLEVAHVDAGKVIGKHGETAQAMRTLLAVASEHSSRKVSLEIANK